MELDKFHILQRQTRAKYHGIAITGTGVCRGTRKVGTTIATGRQTDTMRTEQMQLAFSQIPGKHTTADIIIHDQIQRKIFDKKLGFMFK